MKVLEAIELSKNYGERLAVRGVQLDVEEGEIVGLLGPNGAGKTTTMHMLAGLLAPDSGEVHLLGKPMTRKNYSQRRQLGLVPQNLAVYPELTARENLLFFGKLYGLTDGQLGESVQATLDLCALTADADRLVGTFSQGMKRKLNFGLGLLHRPRVLILDEPTVGVDVESRGRMLEAIRQLAGQGVGILFASHYLQEVETLFHRVAILKDGVMVAWDTTALLLKQSQGLLKFTVRSTQKGLFDSLEGVLAVELGEDDCVHLFIGHSEENLAASLRTIPQLAGHLLENGVELLSIQTQRPSLEQIYFEVTEHSSS